MDTVQCLVAAGADVNAKDINSVTPLHLACFGSRSDVVCALLAAGASSYAEDRDGATPLHVACSLSAMTGGEVGSSGISGTSGAGPTTESVKSMCVG